MLGPEIAVPLDDPAILQASQQQHIMALNKGLDEAHNAADGILQRRSAAAAKSTAARTALGTEAAEVGRWLNLHAPGCGEELGKETGKRVDIRIVPVAAEKATVQHPLGRKADHLDQPIDSKT